MPEGIVIIIKTIIVFLLTLGVVIYVRYYMIPQIRKWIENRKMNKMANKYKGTLEADLIGQVKDYLEHDKSDDDG